MELTELEQLGLAFKCGFIAGSSFKEADEEVEKETDLGIKFEKLEGEDAKKIMKL